MSKQLFELMREEEIQTSNFLPTKKEIQLSAKKFAKKLIDAGEKDKHEIYTEALRLNEVLSVIVEELKDSIPQENFEAFGVKGTYRNGGEILNYKEDEAYTQLEQKLKERAELIKVATKSTDTIYDSEGVEVSKVSSTQRKSSLSITF